MIKEFANKSKEKDHLNWKTQTQHREFEELQKTFHESKGAIDYTGLINTNTAYLSQSYIPLNITHQLANTVKTKSLELWNYQHLVSKRKR